MEVLISVFVLSVGLLGLAALLPVGSFTILETVKADRAGDCGRAALRDVKVRRMLDSRYWSANPGNVMSFIIDPWGVANGATSPFAGYVPRVSLTNLANPQAAFLWPDDLEVSLPELQRPAKPFGRSQIPPQTNPANGSIMTNPDGTTMMMFAGDYSWFLSVTQCVTPASTQGGTPVVDPTRFRVSAVVCYKRDFGQSGSGTPAERGVPVAAGGFLDLPPGGGVALSGGSILLSGPINDAAGTVRAREGDWVALYKQQSQSSWTGLCSWYRVVAISDPDPKNNNAQSLTLNGPDWPWTSGDQDYVLALGQSVLGVYTTVVELDQDPTWQQ